jgi:hypothetical protein
MDYMSDLPSTKHENDCVFVVVDKFSKMAIIIAYKKSIIATNTAKIFFKWVWVHFGIPQTITSNWDNRFLSTFWSSIWSPLDTKLTKSTAVCNVPTLGHHHRAHQRFMMTRVARWMLERVQGYLRGIVGSSLH